MYLQIKKGNNKFPEKADMKTHEVLRNYILMCIYLKY